MINNLLNIVLKGGSGSGNFAHSGRPVKRGGSGGGGGLADRSYENMNWEEYRTAAAMQNREWSSFHIPPEIEEESEEFFNYIQDHSIDTNALKRYSDFSHDINIALRKGKPLDTKQKKIVDSLDLAFEHESSRAPKDMIVLRGGIPSAVREAESFIDNGYSSTSISAGYAGNFGQVITIKVPKDSKAVFNTWSSENEVLLPRGSEFKRQPDDTWLYVG